MSKSLFINLKVEQLDRSVAFFKALGFEFDPDFTNENAACMIINDECYIMLVIPAFFAGFTKKPIADAKSVTESLVAVSLDSNNDVDKLVDLAVSLGAREYIDPEVLDFMYSRSIEDFDGHQWNFFRMDQMPAKHN
jgi:predicted lactoylglutathione lyase